MSLRKRSAILLLAIVLTLGPPARAFAWHNGVGEGEGFGTHDWVLFEAGRIARSEGYRWLDLAVAQSVCDDPDTVLRDFEHHAYDVWGVTGGDAPSYIASLYDEVVSARRAGDADRASEVLGLLSHYVADVCDPLHTDDSTAETRMRSAYEAAVNTRTDTAGENRAWVDGVHLDYVADVEERVIAAAVEAHTDYQTLVDRYASKGMDSVSLAIVSGAMARATDLLADLIASAEADAYDTQVPVSRIAGADRWATAAAISRANYPDGAETVFVASGTAFPDALAAAPLAAAYGAPILLVKQASVPAATATEIARLSPERIIVLGSDAAVSRGVAAELAALAGAAEVQRIAGSDRYATAAAVTTRYVADAGPVDAVFITTGLNFPDALAAAPVAAFAGMPVLLTRPDALPAETRNALDKARPRAAYILGSTAAVSTAVERDLAARGIAVYRLQGSDRYATAAAVAGFADTLGMSFMDPAVASGVSFPDALAAGPVLGSDGRVLLLSAPIRLRLATQAVLRSHADVVEALTFLGSEAAVSGLAAFDAQNALDASPLGGLDSPAWTPCSFSADSAYAHAAALAAIGPRSAGSSGEHRAFDYITAKLKAYGYSVTTQSFLLPNGKTTHNVIAEKAGSDPRFIVLGAHVDTKYPSPGANDNGSGVGTVLELARAFSQTDTVPSVRFVFFGAEEMLDPDPSHHHYGSGHYVTGLTSAEKAEISGMVSVDMVGYGTLYHARTMLVGPQSMSDLVLSVAGREGIKISYLKDPGTYGWSDHEPFERSGIPAVWLEWRDDPVYHTTADVASHLDKRRIKTTGDHLAGLILGLESAEMP